MTHTPLTPTEARVASLLDRYLDGALTADALVQALVGAWERPVDARAAAEALRPVLDALGAAVAPYRRWLDAPCSYCHADRLCGLHRQQLRAVWDLRDDAAREVLHEVPGRALGVGAR